MIRFERLLELLVNRPEGEKVNISAIQRALSPTVEEIAAAIQRLIAAHRLDPQTLRRPLPKPPMPEGYRSGQSRNGVRSSILWDELEAERARRKLSREAVSKAIWGNKARIYRLQKNSTVRAETARQIRAWINNETPTPRPDNEGPTEPPGPGAAEEEGGAARCVVAPPSIPRPSGAELVGRLQAYIDQHGLSKTAVCLRVFNNAGGMAALKWMRRPRPATVDKIEAFLARPPAHDLKPKAAQLATASPDLTHFLQFFRPEWEKLSDPTRRWGEGSTYQFRRIAQQLRDRGLLEFQQRDPQCLWRLASSNTQGASGTAREAPCVGESTSTTRISDRAPEEPASPRAAPARPRRDPTLPPDLQLTELRDRQVTGGHRAAAAVRRGQEARAAKRLDAGLEGRTSIERSLMSQIRRRREDEERLGDPVERAKAVLRKRFTPVVGAEFADPPGPKGLYLVGRKIVSERELIEMAKGLAA